MNLPIQNQKILPRKVRTLFIRPRYAVPLPGGGWLHFGPKTHIMGILNVTPDSFSHDGCGKGDDNGKLALTRARRLIAEGADILDVGGESSRPGSKPVSLQDELKRVLPVVERLHSQCQIPISVDTSKPQVAKAALEAGASIVNYIFGANPKQAMLEVVARNNAVIILMHMRGTPRTMQKNPQYTVLIDDIKREFFKSVEICLEFGIKSDKIILDPGIGFGKTVEHNLRILNRLREFQICKMPIAVGVSRKSFIGQILNQDHPPDRINGSIASACASVCHGAHIVRVHDVSQTREAIKVIDAIMDERIHR
jgi:dihydropteroate synthase